MDIQARETKWPRRPYRGLDYYHERHARLFRERDCEVRQCSQLLLSFGVKILLLHGSSGSGKSSFLRAGLIPALKQARQRSCFFLAGHSGVIRTSSDPLAAIAGALIAVLRQSAVFAIEDAPRADSDDTDDALHVAEDTRQRLALALQAALHDDRHHLGTALIKALAEICADLPGRLVLVLDQAEEVLTRRADGIAESKVAAFFRFLEDVYIRNIDLRLVVTLRTEYYGRFRDELRISDDRLAERPARGGIQQFLLRSLRDPDALVRIIEAPTAAQRADGTPVYGFAFQNVLSESHDPAERKKLARRIVDELLTEFPSSVTPALQVICASLYQQLPEGHGEITHAAYRKSGGARTMILRYITAGIAVVGAVRPAEAEKWQMLLHSLVSRQGGGTVVSLAEAPAELARRAGLLGIPGDIRGCLTALAKGDAPLLRGEPYDAPVSFGLKHDILAVVLARWHDEHGGAANALAREKVKRRVVFLACGAVAVLALTIAATVLCSRSLTLAEAEANNIRLKNAYAERSPTGNYRLSLLLLLANLQTTAQSRSWHRDLLASITAIHAKTERAMREFLHRVPWFVGEYRVTALDPDGARLAALHGNTLYVVDLPDDAAVPRDPNPRPYQLHPTEPPPPGTFAPWPSVGFIDGLGPAAYINNTVQFWQDGAQDRAPEVRPLTLRTLPDTPLPPRVEFIGGRLQIAWMSPGRPVPRYLMRLNANDLRPTDGSLEAKVNRELDSQVQAEAQRKQEADEKHKQEGEKNAQADAPRMPIFRPIAIFSEAPGQLQRFGFLGPFSANMPGLELTYGEALTPDGPQHRALQHYRIDSIARSGEPFPRIDTTLAFAANADAVAYKSDGAKFVVLELSPLPKPLEVTIDPSTSLPWTGAPDSETWRLEQASFPLAYPPFAVVRIAKHWRAAGLGSRGVWVVESSDAAPNRAVLLLGGELPSGEDRGGVKLQFSRDGNYLLLIQQRQFDTGTVRVWNLSPSWRNQIDALPSLTSTQRDRPDPSSLSQLACRAIMADGPDAVFDAMQADVFQVAEPFRQPCRDFTAAGN